MYHRVATPPSDVWEIAVSPQHFEEHLQVLQANWRVMPLSEMVHSLKQGNIPNRSIALTFDDGYADNIEVALPLLEQYKLPATFFLTSINQGPFWWDSLEVLLLSEPHLPTTFLLPFDGGSVDLAEEATLTDDMRYQHTLWKPLEMEPPTKRARLYLHLWQQLRPLAPEQQETFLQTLYLQNKVAPNDLNEVSSQQQLQVLHNHPLIEVGAHTAQHPALGMHPAPFQQEQIGRNKAALEALFQQKIATLAYPYGHYNGDSMQIAEQLTFEAAFTTNPEPLTRRSHRFQLGRFQVADWNGKLLEQKLSSWLRKK
jgi:peptidoglycan/xylan/chitin deacetylase (PgdA/CDA1 family)